MDHPARYRLAFMKDAAQTTASYGALGLAAARIAPDAPATETMVGSLSHGIVVPAARA